MKKGKKRLLTSLLAVALVMASCFGFSMSANAYWDFGVVSLTLGRTEVNVEAGQSVSVSVTLKPASHEQLPGCGMEKCPSSCGNKGCYNNVYNQCGCAGATSEYFETYYPTATISSEKPSVATAEYNNGVITIYGVSEGETELTVVGSLRQWTDSPAETILVTVEPGSGTSSGIGIPADQVNPDSSGSSGGSGNSGGSNQTVDTTNAIAATAVTEENTANTGGTTSGKSNSGTTGTTGGNTQAGAQEETAAETAAETPEETVEGTEAGSAAGTEAGLQAGTEAESATAANAETDEEAEDEITKLEVEDGTYWFVPITGLPQGKEQFEQIMGDERQYVDFQLKDEVENVIYAWEFWGKDVERAEDMVFTIEDSQEAFEGCSYGSSANSLYLTFAEEGEFVGRTSIFYRVSEYFSNGDVLYLYRYDSEDDSLQLVAEELTISNGYVTLPLTEGGSLILTTEELMDAPEGLEEEIEQQPEETDVDAMAETEPEPAEDNTGLSTGALAAIIIVIAAAVAAVIVFLVVRAVRKKKKGSDGDGTGEEDADFWVESEEEKREE